MLEEQNLPVWLKSKGYLHVTPQIDVRKRSNEILRKVSDTTFIAKYAFYPLIHSAINERRYKKLPDKKKRGHSYIDKSGKPKKNVKSRPLHYATHMDSIIYGCYAEKLQQEYEKKLVEYPGLSESIIAYRKIPIDKEHNKSTIHFAHEIFEEIKKRAEEHSECYVLAFDIKSFFSSLDHNKLKEAWASLLGEKNLPEDHYNVFKSATRFSYILKDDLRIYQSKKGKKSGFDEKKLAFIRNEKGVNSFFESPLDFRKTIKSGALRIHKFPFRNKKNEPIGIPQGLAISAILANLYLLEFDLKILERLVNGLGCYYRRYSDDIAVVCKPDQAVEVNKLVNEAIAECLVEISQDKTEKFLFKKMSFGKKPERLTAIKITNEGDKIDSPFIYLGFQFNGSKALIKSANLSKFYRRMISAVKRKANRAKKIALANPGTKPVVFKRQLYKLYKLPLNKTKVRKRWKRLRKNEKGGYSMLTGVNEKKLKSNYFTYVTRASEIMAESAIGNQIRNHKKIFNQALVKHVRAKKVR